MIRLETALRTPLFHYNYSRSLVMGIMLRSVTSLCLIGCLGFGLAFAQPRMLEEAGLDIYNLPQLHAELTNYRQQTNELDEQTLSFRNRVQKKNQLLDDLIADKLTVVEACDRIRSLYSAPEWEMVCFSLDIEEQDSNTTTMKMVLYWMNFRYERGPSPDLAQTVERVSAALSECRNQSTTASSSARTVENRS